MLLARSCCSCAAGRTGIASVAHKVTAIADSLSCISYCLSYSLGTDVLLLNWP